MSAPEGSRRGRLQEKIVLVTGGGTGIGRAIALLCAREGGQIVVCGRRSEPLQEVVKEIRRSGGAATFARGDVGRADRAEMVVQSATYNFGGLDVVVNCAGIFLGGSIVAMDERRWDRVLSTNLKGPFLVSRAAVPAMRRRGGGSIVNIAAAAGLRGRKEAAAWSASKGGLIALTRSMALDLAPDRIRVNAVCPGPVESPVSRDGDPGGPSAGTDEPARCVPLQRAGSPEDVANAVVYLASEESAWVTGAVFTIDGGVAA